MSDITVAERTDLWAVEKARIRRTYADRETKLAGGDSYSLANPAYLFTIQQRQRAILSALQREGLWPLAGKRILELGCGTGGVLLELLAFGGTPALLHGTDLLAERVTLARARLPHLPLNCAHGGRLPYPDRSFDLVLQFTVFSSILDQPVCYTVSQEIVRVLKPDGLILWYDFWINPFNKQTRGVRPHEIRDYFPGSRLNFERITLAPPLARRLVPKTWVGALLLEKLRLFNTHYLATIRPGG
ncbi:MAG: class I SAM-dependent methyltransferase [Chloroflexota bacterium]|jgi:ubiquinone/menaquinone biosynthesis C-methylase UbiE